MFPMLNTNQLTMRYFLVLSYVGTAYHGWQIQANAYTVQQAVHEALSRLLGEPISVTGSGRTDSGVHARQQVAHFDTAQPVPNNLLFRLNAILPPDIGVHRLFKVAPEAHARFDARARSYEYLMHTFKDPFAQGSSYCIRFPLRLDLINEATQLLVAYGERNYACFSKSGTQQTTFRCHIVRAEWAVTEESAIGQRMVFRITANRFLRGMVRAIVGTLLDIGTEKITLEDFRAIVESQDRRRASRAVPAHGLYLTEVAYEF